MSTLALFPDDRDGAGDRDCWATPDRFVRHLELELGRPFRLDVCAYSWSRKAPVYYSPAEDGLVQPWHVDQGEGLWWCNPPFSAIGPWARKAWRESLLGSRGGAMLLPAGVIQHPWFHDYVIGGGATIHYLRGRVAFEPPPGVAPSSPAFPCFLALWGVAADTRDAGR